MRTDTDNVMYYTNEHYDLIFTPAEQIVVNTDTDSTPITYMDDKKIVKTVINRNCVCGDCGDCNDWISGDIVDW